MVRYIQNGQGQVNKQIAIHGAKDVEAIINGQGKIEQSYHYSPNGILRPIDLHDQIAQITQPRTGNFSITENPFQYSGQYRDSESGLDYLRARYYNPKIQRFIQRDSYQLLNRYGYVKGNPIMGVDPSGHFAEMLGMNYLAQGISDFFLWLLGGLRSVTENSVEARQLGDSMVQKSVKQPLEYVDDRTRIDELNTRLKSSRKRKLEHIAGMAGDIREKVAEVDSWFLDPDGNGHPPSDVQRVAEQAVKSNLGKEYSKDNEWSQGGLIIVKRNPVAPMDYNGVQKNLELIREAKLKHELKNTMMQSDSYNPEVVQTNLSAQREPKSEVKWQNLEPGKANSAGQAIILPADLIGKILSYNQF